MTNGDDFDEKGSRKGASVHNSAASGESSCGRLHLQIIIIIMVIMIIMMMIMLMVIMQFWYMTASLMMMFMLVMMLACRQIPIMTKCCILFEGIALNINEISAAAAWLLTMMVSRKRSSHFGCWALYWLYYWSVWGGTETGMDYNYHNARKSGVGALLVFWKRLFGQ